MSATAAGLLSIISAITDVTSILATLAESGSAMAKAQAEGRELTDAERGNLLSDDDEAALKLYAAIARRRARDQNAAEPTQT